MVANGTSSFGMKYIVLVPSVRFSTPWVNLPNSLASDFSQITLSGPLIKCRYSCSTPVSGLRTALACKLVRAVVALAYHARVNTGCCLR